MYIAYHHPRLFAIAVLTFILICCFADITVLIVYVSQHIWSWSIVCAKEFAVDLYYQFFCVPADSVSMLMLGLTVIVRVSPVRCHVTPDRLKHVYILLCAIFIFFVRSLAD